MPKTMVTVGTRKGAFVVESENRRDWTVRGPFCEGWPVYHTVYDPGSGSIYAAAASEWHGSAIWRSRDLGATWELSSEGLSYGDDAGRKLSKVSTLALAGDRLLAGVEAPGIFESRDGGETDGSRMFQQNHVGMHRSDDGGQSWTEITDGLPSEFGFAAAVHPHDRDTFYVIPLDPGHGRVMPEGKAAVWQTRDGGSSWRALRNGLPQSNAHLGVLRQGMAIDAQDVPGLYVGTSTGQVFASVDEGASGRQVADYLPAISSVDVAVVD